MTDYDYAPEVQAIAEQLIPLYHDHLLGQEVRYIFRDTAKKSNGYETWGTASLVKGRNAFFASKKAKSSKEAKDFAVVEIARNIWERITDKEKAALVDHELCHIDVDINDETGITKLVLKHHDLEEFGAVLKRYGLWRAEIGITLAELGPQQLQLFVDQLGQKTKP